MKRFIECAFKIVFSRTLIILFMMVLQILVLLGGFIWLEQYMVYLWEGMSLLGAVLILHIINKDEPTEFKMTWIIIICLLPVFGALIYVFVVGNFGGIGQKANQEYRINETRGLLKTSEETKAVIRRYPAVYQGFVRYMRRTAGFPVYHKSDAVYFASGEEKFHDMLEELKKAKHYIFLEYFIVEQGEMWNAILEILKEKAAAGVEVRVMYDGMCSLTQLPYRYPRKLKKYGIKAKMFAPIVPFLSTTQNNRDHRKILVIDGRVAYTGGVNLADEYINQKERFGHWKDIAVKISGEAVKSFTVMFLQMWYMSALGKGEYKKYLDHIDYGISAQGTGLVIPYANTPGRKTDVAKTVYQSMIDRAVKYVHIMTPYFVVEREFLDSMRYAAQRGVEVAMILPHIPDKKTVYYLARTYYPELLKAGIKVYEYTPGFIHAKCFVSDDVSAVVGTVNLDYRSFYHHFECGACFYDNKVVWQAECDFQNTLEVCREVTMDYYKKIPLYQKLLGKMFKLFAPLL